MNNLILFLLGQNMHSSSSLNDDHSERSLGSSMNEDVSGIRETRPGETGYVRPGFTGIRKPTTTKLENSGDSSSPKRDPLAVARERVKKKKKEQKSLFDEDGIPMWKKKLMQKKREQAEEKGDVNLPSWKKALLEKKKREKEAAKRNQDDTQSDSRPLWMKELNEHKHEDFNGSSVSLRLDADDSESSSRFDGPLSSGGRNDASFGYISNSNSASMLIREESVTEKEEYMDEDQGEKKNEESSAFVEEIVDEQVVEEVLEEAEEVIPEEEVVIPEEEEVVIEESVVETEQPTKLKKRKESKQRGYFSDSSEDSSDSESSVELGDGTDKAEGGNDGSDEDTIEDEEGSDEDAVGMDEESSEEENGFEEEEEQDKVEQDETDREESKHDTTQREDEDNESSGENSKNSEGQAVEGDEQESTEHSQHSEDYANGRDQLESLEHSQRNDDHSVELYEDDTINQSQHTDHHSVEKQEDEHTEHSQQTEDHSIEQYHHEPSGFLQQTEDQNDPVKQPKETETDNHDETAGEVEKEYDYGSAAGSTTAGSTATPVSTSPEEASKQPSIILPGRSSGTASTKSTPVIQNRRQIAALPSKKTARAKSQSSPSKAHAAQSTNTRVISKQTLDCRKVAPPPVSLERKRATNQNQISSPIQRTRTTASLSGNAGGKRTKQRRSSISGSAPEDSSTKAAGAARPRRSSMVEGRPVSPSLVASGTVGPGRQMGPLVGGMSISSPMRKKKVLGKGAAPSNGVKSPTKSPARLTKKKVVTGPPTKVGGEEAQKTLVKRKVVRVSSEKKLASKGKGPGHVAATTTTTAKSQLPAKKGGVVGRDTQVTKRGDISVKKNTVKVVSVMNGSQNVDGQTKTKRVVVKTTTKTPATTKKANAAANAVASTQKKSDGLKKSLTKAGGSARSLGKTTASEKSVGTKSSKKKREDATGEGEMAHKPPGLRLRFPSLRRNNSS